MRMYRVYALADPQSHVVRYVGRTRQPVDARYQQHRSGNNPGTAAWISTLMLPPTLILLEVGEEKRVPRKGSPGSVSASAFAETKWIKRFRHTLINQMLRESSPTTWDWLTNPDERGTNGKAA